MRCCGDSLEISFLGENQFLKKQNLLNYFFFFRKLTFSRCTVAGAFKIILLVYTYIEIFYTTHKNILQLVVAESFINT